MTKREFKLWTKAYDEGMIKAYQGILSHCKVCIQAHRKEITKKRLEELAQMNRHMWK